MNLIKMFSNAITERERESMNPNRTFFDHKKQSETWRIQVALIANIERY